MEVYRCGPTKWKLQAIRNANADWRSAESAPRWKKVCCKVSYAQDSRESYKAQFLADILRGASHLQVIHPKNDSNVSFLSLVLSSYAMKIQFCPM